ncbi:MAG: hypothetical protein EA397_10545 [Deltaproteobacteria bacterium]|nr:MAG: hypothetical protein EA397_10545 [Deltaproteobacteria bacterium]
MSWLWLACLMLGWASPEEGDPAALVLPDSTIGVQIDPDADEAVAQAVELLAQGRFESSARALSALAAAGGGARARYLESLAWYEAGQLKRAIRSAKAAVETDAEHGAAWSLLGLIHADRGEGDQAEAALRRAEQRAEASHDLSLGARVRVNRALVARDQGQLDRSRLLLTEALGLAEEASDPTVVALSQASLASLGEGASEAHPADVLGAVAARLRKGDTAGARAAIPTVDDPGRREGVRLLLAAAAVDRAEGHLDAAALKVRAALHEARTGGLVRETAAALAELGNLLSLAGHFSAALDALHEAVGTVSGTSFRVLELSYRVEAGRVAVRLGELTQARDQLAAAERVAKELPEDQGGLRLLELKATIAQGSEDFPTAIRVFSEVGDRYEASGDRADAARVSAALVTVLAQSGASDLSEAEARALRRFESAGIQAGPAHLAIARGLGLARSGELVEAVESFVEAARLAEAVGTERGAQIAEHARANAAEALRTKGLSSEESARLVASADLSEAMEANERYVRGEERYRAAHAAYGRGDYPQAREAFTEAIRSFEKLGDPALLAMAHRGRGWAARNAAIRLEGAEALRLFILASKDAERAQDPDLKVRARVGAALSSASLDRRDANQRLLEAAELAEGAGRIDDAVRCLAELAERLPALDARIEIARRAALLDPSSPLVSHALYSVAVDAYNYGDHELALTLAQEVAPNAGSLADAVEAVRAAAAAELGR